MTRTRSRGTLHARTIAAAMHRDPVTTAADRLAPDGIIARRVLRRRGVNHSGCSSTSTSWIATVTGQRANGGG